MAKLNDRDAGLRATRELGGADRAEYSEALERGLRVLTAFERDEERLSQSQVARKLGLPRATVRRALLTLTHLGYLEADDNAYRLAPKVLTLASAYLTTNPVSRVVQPVCDELAERFQTSCTAAVLDGPVAVMIARGIPRQLPPIGQGVGFNVPAVHSALGQVLISNLDVERRRQYLLAHETDDEEVLARLETGLAEVAAQGYAYVAHDVEAEFHSIAVRLDRWDGTAIAALNVGSSFDRISSQAMVEHVLPVLRETATMLRSRLV